MPNPTRQEIIDANNALAALVCVALSNTSDPDEKDWIRTIARALTAALPPKPRPTMAEIEWEDDKHYLAEAESARFGKVVMLGESSPSTQIDILVNNDQGIGFQLEHPADLTPTGKRYTLTEVETHAS